jgi:transposase
MDPARLVFIDETWAKTNMTRARGRCRRGARLVGRAPFGHWTTTTFVAGLRRDGVTAPFVIKGAINGPSFRAYVTKCLAPTLRPGDTVVMDNLGSHRSPKVRQAIESQGASLRYLPPYSPDLNPIELMFSKLKALLRRAEERSVSSLWDRIGMCLDQVGRPECANYFKAAGYAPA